MATEDKNGCLHDDKTGQFTKKDYTQMSVAELRTRQAKEYREKEPYEVVLAKAYDEMLQDEEYNKNKTALENEINEKIRAEIEKLKASKHYDAGIVDFAKNAIEGKIKPTAIYTVGKISDRQRRDIEHLTGERLEATISTISAQQIVNHIDKGHGANGKSDHSMEDLTNYSLMNCIINDYDSVELATKKGSLDLSTQYLNKHNERAKQIIFKKSIGKNYIVVEAITDSVKNKDIKIVSMFVDYRKK